MRVESWERSTGARSAAACEVIAPSNARRAVGSRNYPAVTREIIPIMFPLQPLHDQRSAAYFGKERRRIPGLSKAQRRIKASSTPALLDRDVER